MYRVLACLTDLHDYRLVAIAALVCGLASMLAFVLYSAALDRNGNRRVALLILTGLCTAVGIWSTHFVAMLAYEPGLPVGYDLAFTVGSFFIAVMATTAGFCVMSRGGRPNAALGGSVIGVGIAGMHFMGMMAIVVAGHPTWDRALAVASVVLGVVLASAAALAHTSARKHVSKIGAPILLALAICAMHFTAMGAATYVANPALAAPGFQIDSFSLAVIVTAVTLVLMVASGIYALFDRFTVARGAVGFSTSIIVLLAIMVGVGAYTINNLRIGGPNFQRIVASKDLVADILPPPAYIIEAYLEARIAITQPERLAEHQDRLAVLRKDYLARRDHWSASTQIPSATRRALVDGSGAQVELFWQELATSYLPALSANDMSSAALSLDRLTSIYLAHRQIIEDVVKQANQFSETVESSAQAQGAFLETLMVGVVLLMFAAVIAAVAALNSFVIKPLLTTAGYLDMLRAGRYDAQVPYVGRSDEIGAMAQAIDMLRQGSIDKQRLEQEAVETRRRSDEERRARDKEKIAEALQLHMANENISGLNDDLHRAIGNLKNAQEENIRKSKLAQLGQLTATVAHEIRNPLGSIKTAMFVIERKTKDKELAIETPVKRVYDGIQRCDQIITELLDFTRAKILAETAQSVDGWVAKVLEEERRSLASEVAVAINSGIGEDLVIFDASRMRRVIINLLSNASEAMVGKGNQPAAVTTTNPTITVSTRIVGDSVEIVVTDNGPGISPENLAKIREPLFTTKSFGVGLGLPAVEKILEQHGGGLRIDSTLGEGATMTAWFPLKRGASDTANLEERKVA